MNGRRSGSLSLLTLPCRDSEPWQTPVLGKRTTGGSPAKDVQRRERSLALVPNTKKLSNVPKLPHPERTLQIFTSVRSGLRQYIEETNDMIGQLRNTEFLPTNSPTNSPAVQFRMLEIEKQLKLTDRYLKRLEFQLTKIEELEENYKLYLQLREGTKTMAKAYLSHGGISWKSSVQSVESGFKECTQTLCCIEAHLQSLLGTFQCKMKGLVGFARLVTGDVFDVSLKYGNQKWKTRCNIGPLDQTCDPQGVSLKVLVTDMFIVKVHEIKSLGRTVFLGEKRCDTRDLFSAHTQSMTISLSASGSIKLGLLVHWNPLDGVEEGTPLVFDSSPQRFPLYCPKLILPSTPSNRQQEQQQEHTVITRHSSDNSRVIRYSMPVFPAVFNPSSSPDFIPSFLSQSPPSQRSPALSIESEDGQMVNSRESEQEDEDAPVSLGGFIPRVYYGEQTSVSSNHRQRPRSAVETNRPSSDPKIARWPLNDFSSELKPEEEETDFRFGKISSRSESVSFSDPTGLELPRTDITSDVVRKQKCDSAMEIEIKRDFTDLNRVSSIDCRPLESILVEDALGAFSFLDSEECLESNDERTEGRINEGFATSELGNFRNNAITHSTDSGIGSLAHRLNSDSIEF